MAHKLENYGIGTLFSKSMLGIFDNISSPSVYLL